jgi:protein-S-isoprenylcysteine O-methyltransferase Ste14
MPITMVIVVPALLLRGHAHIAGWPLATVGIILFVAAASLFLTTEYLFNTVGKGTLAPWNQTQELVLTGPYRYCRNPMISAVLGMIVAEALFFASWALVAWGLVFLVVNTAYFRLSEEPGLERRFGSSYSEYKHAVPRWVPRPTPYRGDRSSHPRLTIERGREDTG